MIASQIFGKLMAQSMADLTIAHHSGVIRWETAAQGTHSLVFSNKKVLRFLLGSFRTNSFQNRFSLFKGLFHSSELAIEVRVGHTLLVDKHEGQSPNFHYLNILFCAGPGALLGL